MKKAVLKVWNSEKENIINYLSLKEEPKLEFASIASLKNVIMQTEIIYLYDKFGIVTGTEASYKIEVNPFTTGFMVFVNLVATGFKKPKFVSHTTLKFYLCHECRHIWQAQEDFFSGKSLLTYTEREYSTRPHEKDANTWACDVFYKDKQAHAIALLCKSMQERKNIIKSIVRAWKILK